MPPVPLLSLPPLLLTGSDYLNLAVIILAILIAHLLPRITHTLESHPVLALTTYLLLTRIVPLPDSAVGAGVTAILMTAFLTPIFIRALRSK